MKAGCLFYRQSMANVTKYMVPRLGIHAGNTYHKEGITVCVCFANGNSAISVAVSCLTL